MPDPIQLRATTNNLADDVGRLRRRFASNPDAWTGAYILDRIASHIEQLHLAVTPSAGELALEHAPGQPAAINEAIHIADQQWATLQHRLRKTAA